MLRRNGQRNVKCDNWVECQLKKKKKNKELQIKGENAKETSRNLRGKKQEGIKKKTKTIVEEGKMRLCFICTPRVPTGRAIC
jgi:hypothetical protein